LIGHHRIFPLTLLALSLPLWAEAEPRAYVRPFGEKAPWNIPVACLPRHLESNQYARRLWDNALGAHARPGNFNLTFDGYTYPVYHAVRATPTYPIETSRETNIDGARIPWDPKWRPAEGTDGQVIILDQESGREWDLFQVSFDGKRVRATNGSLVPGDYRTRESGHPSSRGAGIPYLAMLVRPEELIQGQIRHALSMPIRNTDGLFFVPPATKLEHPDNPPDGIPEGMRFALNVTDQEIEDWLASLPTELPEQTRISARIIARALRDYGWFITDTSGSAHLQFEDRLTAGAAWENLGLQTIQTGYKEYPRDLLDGLITKSRIYAVLPSDQYP
jgi:hypothetical protein